MSSASQHSAPSDPTHSGVTRHTVSHGKPLRRRPTARSAIVGLRGEEEYRGFEILDVVRCPDPRVDDVSMPAG